MAKQTKALVKQAEALGIEVDGRWGDETIQERIDAARSAKEGERSAAEKAADDVARLEGEAGAGGDGGELAGAAEGADGVGAVVLSDAAVESEPSFDEANNAGSIALDDAPGAADGGEPDGEHGGGDPDRASGSDGGLSVTGDPFPEAEDAQDDDVSGNGDGSGGVGPASSEAADFGDGSAGVVDGPLGSGGSEMGDGAGLDGTDLRRWEIAQNAMTGPIDAAFCAASGVYKVLARVNDFNQMRWLSDSLNNMDIVIALVTKAVPFVRTWPMAPPEALFMTVRDEAPELELAGGWLDLPWEKRVAWETFRDVLVRVDQMVAAEEARAQAPASGGGVRRVPIDETTLEEVDDPMGLSELGRLAQKRSAAEDAALGRDLALKGF